MNSEQLKENVLEALDDMKAQEIVAIDISDVSNFADYMIVASGTSGTHVKAIANNAAKELSIKGVKPLSEEGADVSEWVLIDFGDVVLNVMRPEVRAFYELEKLWDTDVRKMLEESRLAETE